VAPSHWDQHLIAVHAVGAAAGVDDVDRAMQAARKAFDEGEWPRMGGKVRGALDSVSASQTQSGRYSMTMSAPPLWRLECCAA
jgi:hypothetical protein